MNLSRRSFLLAAAVATGGCATATSTTQSAASGVSIRRHKVFAYSFLDVHDTLFGPAMLSSLDDQLVRSLAAGGAETSMFHFNDSTFAQSIAAVNGGIVIPVKARVAANVDNERRAGADFRLLILPSKMQLSGAWKHFEIRWELVQIGTSSTIWSCVTEGKHQQPEKDAEARAREIVSGVSAELRRSGII